MRWVGSATSTISLATERWRAVPRCRTSTPSGRRARWRCRRRHARPSCRRSVWIQRQPAQDGERQNRPPFEDLGSLRLCRLPTPSVMDRATRVAGCGACQGASLPPHLGPAERAPPQPARQRARLAGGEAGGPRGDDDEPGGCPAARPEGWRHSAAAQRPRSQPGRRSHHGRCAPGRRRPANWCWYQPIETSDGLLDLAGNPNILTLDVPASAFSGGCAAHTCLVAIERYEGNAPLPEFTKPELVC